jgi:hypothetical protein
MGKILPILLAVLGLGAGAGAGLMLRPEPEPVEVDEQAEADAETEAAEEAAAAELDFVKLNNQFIVPIVREGQVTAMIALSVSLQVKIGMREDVFAREPKLRDLFLRVMFDHANAGGFDGQFTSSDALGALRRAMLEAARSVMGRDVSDILITDIVRQDT